MTISVKPLDYEKHSLKRSLVQNIGTALTSKIVVLKRKKEFYWSELAFNTTDVTLVVNNQEISANKYVLASNSEYFNRMFTSSFKETKNDKVDIIDLGDYETLSTLIDFFYTSSLTITELNVQELLISANELLLDDVQDACVDLLKSVIDIENCFNMKNLASSLGLDYLYAVCLKFMFNNFRLVANNQEFLTITYNEIIFFIKDDDLFANEEMVYDVVMKWIRHNPLIRFKYSSELLWYVRLPLILNTYQGIINIHELACAKINSLSSFRKEHRKPFRKAILMFSFAPMKLSPEWYDATSNKWKICTEENCPCKILHLNLSPPEYLSTCYLLNDGRLFAVGGFDSGQGMKSAYIFNLKRNTWFDIPNMNYGRIKPHIMQLKLKVFVIGGCSEENFHTVEYFDLETHQWVVVKNKDVGTSSLNSCTYAACVNEFIYSIEPCGSGYYNSLNDEWNSIVQLPIIMQGAAVCTLNNNIYVIGGRFEDNYLKSVFAYCTDTKVWVAIADMNCPRSYSGAVVMNGFIYVFGGKADEGSYLNTFEIYDSHENKWTLSNTLMENGCISIDAFVVDKSCILFQKLFKCTIRNIIH
ncbi:Galactose oxidase/kelch, beta-propeller,BTB/Kelch-associated,Galactose oxidase, beta- [Cinara cedri]|uniref:Kelch-like protein diablo n=1 Tax=Cinara cedri TaxID=506608 RepID=A0A5E4MXB2_9HEMI|nr:Galactose oxidase/kelch, beta-propeller,BTB/Kelch-associated,Galactose oxidase, beta- [Cinara cedri]